MDFFSTSCLDALPSSSSGMNLLFEEQNTMNNNVEDANAAPFALSSSSSSSSSSMLDNDDIFSNADDFSSVLNILDSAQDIILQDNSDNNNNNDVPFTSTARTTVPVPVPVPVRAFQGQADNEADDLDSLLLEPTPLGPQGVQSGMVKAPNAFQPSNDMRSLFSLWGGSNMQQQQQAQQFQQLQQPLEVQHPAKRQRMAGPSELSSFSNMFPSCSGNNGLFGMISAAPTSMSSSSPLAKPELSHSSASNVNNNPKRFRSYQCNQWQERFQDLVNFQKKNGHCLVPHNFPENQHLAQWIKRQRYQFKLKEQGRHSTISDERQVELENLGFVWDSHKAAWYEKLEALKEYQRNVGNCNVPSNYKIDKPLAVWVKCQRRQMKLLQRGKTSTMTQERIQALNAIGFDWNPRNL